MKTVAAGNDWEYEYRAIRKNSATGTPEPATGLTGLFGHFSATDKGATIHASLRVPLTERGSTGLYYGVAQGDDIETNLFSGGVPIYPRVYEVFGDAGDVITSIPRLVSAIRRP